MTINRTRLASAAIIIAPALLALAAPAAGQKLVEQGPGTDDPVLMEGQWDAGPHGFFLDNSQEKELVRFDTARRVEVCDRAGSADADGPAVAQPIKVMADGQTAIIQPGSCTTLNARSVKVAAAGSLDDDAILEGQVRALDTPGS